MAEDSYNPSSWIFSSTVYQKMIMILLKCHAGVTSGYCSRNSMAFYGSHLRLIPRLFFWQFQLGKHLTHFFKDQGGIIDEFQ